METFLIRSEMLERVERTVGIEEGDELSETTRKVADWVSGASTLWGEMGTRWLMLALLVAAGEEECSWRNIGRQRGRLLWETI